MGGLGAPGSFGREFGLSGRLTTGSTSDRPVGDIEWYQCPNITHERIECGSIVVPLSYFNSNEGTATIALAKYKADSNLRRGSVFVNPGGPGAPGKWLVTQLGDSLATAKIGLYYDIVAFDPRGIGDTIPKVQCFESRESKDQYYRNTVFELGYNTTSKRNG